MALELKLARPDRTYRPPDVVNGVLIISSPSPLSHQGIRITAAGTVLLQPSSRSMGVIESLYNSVTPIQLLKKSVDISPAGKVTTGKLELPFHISLDGPKVGSGDVMYETYHGAYINIQYLITAEVLKGYLQKGLSATLEFIVEGGTGKISRPLSSSAETVCFYITQDTQKHPLLSSIHSGGFRVTGRVATFCSLTEPVTGELVVDASAVPIHSIDIHLLRIEYIALGERMVSETTEIQTTQIADGDVCRGISLPIHLILPRLLTCPTVSARSFSLEFGLSIIITFQAELAKFYSELEPITNRQWVAFETLPLRLMRL